MSVTLEQAENRSTAAKVKAKSVGVPMNSANVDEGTKLVPFRRMDNAWLGCIDIAIKKARTARFFEMDSGGIGNLSRPGGPRYPIEFSGGGLISFPGGVQLQDSSGKIAAAIGVSGATVDQDHAVASAGAAIRSTLLKQIL